jgi:hypothetical protein
MRPEYRPAKISARNAHFRLYARIDAPLAISIIGVVQEECRMTFANMKVCLIFDRHVDAIEADFAAAEAVGDRAGMKAAFKRLKTAQSFLKLARSFAACFEAASA